MRVGLRSGDELPFYSVSSAKLSLLSLSTFGLYELYWFYKNWVRIKEHSEPDIRPFWRALFSPLFCHRMAGAVNSAADSAGVSGRLPEGVIAAAYFILLALHRLPDPFWMISFFSFLPLLAIRRKIEDIHKATQPGLDPTVGWSFRSYFALALGSAVTVVAVFGTFGPPTRALRGPEIPSSYAESLVEAGVLVPGERIEYFYSGGLFSILEDGNLLTDRRVASYEKIDDELLVYSARYDEIDDIDVEYSTHSLEDTMVTVSAKGDNVFLLYVSQEDGRDKEFVLKLEAKLKAHGGS